MEDAKKKIIEDESTKNGLLKRFREDAELLISLVGDYWRGVYRNVPFWVIATVCFVLLYLLRSFHFIPGMLPDAGLLHIFAAIGICLYLVYKEIKKYRQWKLDNCAKPASTERESEDPYP